MTAPAGHVHAFEMFQTFHRAPTGPWPNHTSFVVLACEQAGCGAIEIFPRSNFDLCTAEFQQEFFAAATAAGRHLADEHQPTLPGVSRGTSDSRPTAVGVSDRGERSDG